MNDGILNPRNYAGAPISSMLFVHFMSNIFHNLFSPFLPQTCQGAPASKTMYELNGESYNRNLLSISRLQNTSLILSVKESFGRF